LWATSPWQGDFLFYIIAISEIVSKFAKTKDTIMVYSISINETTDWGRKLAEFLVSLGAFAGEEPLSDSQIQFMHALKESKEIEKGIKMGKKYPTLDDLLEEI